MGRRGGRRLSKQEIDAVLRRFTAVPKWRGTVERLSSLSPERREALGLSPIEERQSEIAIRLCQNTFCRHWTPSRKRFCIICHCDGPPRAASVRRA